LEIQKNSLNSDNLKPVFHLSKDGKNVVIVFLDRAINSFFPYVLEQVPQLKEQMQGFVYYPNTVSFGTGTIFGSPSLMGGYEYTPEEMNKRATEKLVDKHNEAVLVMPKLFLDAGYQVTVTDPPFCNYKWKGDFTPFKKYPEIDVISLVGRYSVQYKNEFSDVLEWDETNESTIIRSRLPVFSLLKIIVPMLRKTLYDNGQYFLMAENPQNLDKFLASYSTLYYLDKITDNEAQGNTFTFIDNTTTHEPTFLQVPEFEPRSVVTNTETPFDDVVDIQDIDLQTYHANAASLKRLGLWFEQLKKDGVYDNTRIIIVADHGKNVYTPRFANFETNNQAYSRYNPLLLVKDFEAKGDLVTNGTFMTNADTSLLAIENLDVSSVNPFTGKDLKESVQKQVLHVCLGPWDPKKNLGTMFNIDYSGSFTVHDDITIESNWGPLEK
jgi:hypothetical protein